MRVAFDASSMRGRKTGIGVYTESLMQALRDLREPDLELVGLDDGTTADQRTDRRIWREQLVLPRLAAQARADLLHLTGFAAPARSPCLVILSALDLIGVLFAHYFPLASRLYWSRYLPWTLRFPAALVTLSENTKRDLVRLARVPAERIHVIPPGCDARFRPLTEAEVQPVRAALGLPERFFLCVSTLEPRKGIDTLIDAYARAAAQAEADLIIVGKRGWDWPRLEGQIARAGLGSRLRLLDYVPDEHLPALYNLALAFVYPSRYEGFGLPPLEAMACGAPVICSNASALPEVVGEAARLVSPDDAGALAHALVEAAHDAGLRTELRQRGLRRAAQFSWERAAQRTMELYHSALGTLRGGAIDAPRA